MQMKNFLFLIVVLFAFSFHQNYAQEKVIADSTSIEIEKKLLLKSKNFPQINTLSLAHLRYSLVTSYNIQLNKQPPFSTFEASLKNALKKEYQERTKYDLGHVGKYLGLSKKATAIVLAILSLL